MSDTASKSPQPLQASISLHDAEKIVPAFDDWFRYAETIGQQRLQTFLQTASVLLVACVAALVVPNYVLVSIPLSFFGLLLSIIWYFIGTRQCKFHEAIDNAVGHWLNRLEHVDDKERFPIHHVRNLKEKGRQQGGQPQLSAIEERLPTRNLLYIVPIIFGLAYWSCLVFAMIRLC